jgi:hypothetical protein
VGDILLKDKQALNILIYNRDLLYKKGREYLELRVKDNTWTTESALNLLREFSYELDGDKERTAKDAFGLTADTKARFAAFCVGAGLTFTQWDAYGMPTLSTYKDEMGAAIDASLKLCFDNKLDWFTPGRYFVGDLNAPAKIFSEGRSLIYCTNLEGAEALLHNGIPFVYGFLPYPKLNAQQESYHTLVDFEESAVFAVPHTANGEFAGYALQVAMEQSTDTVKATYLQALESTDDTYELYIPLMLDLLENTAAYDPIMLVDYSGITKFISYSIPALEANILETFYPTLKKMVDYFG